MPSSPSKAHGEARHAFGDFTLTYDRFELRRNGVRIPLEPRVFDLLAYLVQNRDRIVPSDELLQVLWADRTVTAASLTVAVSAARKALGDTPDNARFIRTHRSRGYQFVGTLSSTIQGSNVSILSRPLPPFVGRSFELESLLALARDTTAARGGVVAVSGEPGIGKTRLLQEFARTANSAGITLFLGRCSEDEGAPAFWPWLQILRMHLAFAQTASLPPPSPQELLELPRLIPELAGDSKGPTSPRTSPATRFHLFDTVTQWLARTVEKHPLILAFDDIHRADLPSLQLIQFLAHNLQNDRLSIIVTYRDADIDKSPPHAAALALLSRTCETKSLQLKGLTAIDIAKFLKSVVGSQPTQSLVSTLHDRTSGNPFFLAQILPFINFDAPSPLPSRLPHGLRAAISNQLDTLSSTCRDTLRIAAVFGRNVPQPLLEKVVGSSAEDSRASIQEALDARILIDDPRRPGRLRFVHALVRETLYEEIRPARRAALHRKIADALEPLLASSGRHHIQSVAYHYFRGSALGSTEKALAYCVRAAAEATATLAYEEAAEQYSRALDLVDNQCPIDDESLCDLLLALGEAQTRAGDRRLARSTFSRAAELTRRLDAPERLARVALELAPGFLSVEAGAVDAFLQQLLHDALAGLGTRDRRLRAMLSARLALALVWSDESQRRYSLAREATALAREIGDPDLAVYVDSACWLAEWRATGVVEREVHAGELVQRAQKAADKETRLLCKLLHLTSLLEIGDLCAFDRAAVDFVGLAEETRQPSGLWYADLLRATRALLGGRLGAAEELAHKFADIGGRVGDRNAFHSAMAHWLNRAWDVGGLAEFIVEAEKAVEAYPTLLSWRAALAWVYSKVGRLREAKREFDTIARYSDEFRELPQRIDWAFTVAVLAEVCGHLRCEKSASRLFDLLRPLAGRNIVLGLCVVYWGPADRYLGLLASTMGEFEMAMGFLADAVQSSNAVAAPAWVARCEMDLATFLLKQGGREDIARAGRLLTRVGNAAGSLGLSGLASEARALARSRDTG